MHVCANLNTIIKELSFYYNSLKYYSRKCIYHFCIKSLSLVSRFSFCHKSKQVGRYEHLSHRIGCGSNRSDFPVLLVLNKFFKLMQMGLERQTLSYSWDFVFE